MSDFLVRPVQATDRNWIESFVKSHWGSEIVVAKARVIRPATLMVLQPSREKMLSAY